MHYIPHGWLAGAVADSHHHLVSIRGEAAQGDLSDVQDIWLDAPEPVVTCSALWIRN
jgi:hypothetical protein